MSDVVMHEAEDEPARVCQLPTDMLRSLNGDGVADVQEFVSMVVTHNKPPTPSASTPYRQLKRLHSTQVSPL